MPKRKQPVTTKYTVADAVSSAFGTIEELANEMREAFDNTPESLQQSGVGEARGEAADALENLSEPDVPESLADLEFEHTTFPIKGWPSRSKRRDEVTSILHAVIDMLDNIDDDIITTDASSLRDELDNLISEAEEVEFPGMYG